MWHRATLKDTAGKIRVIMGILTCIPLITGCAIAYNLAVERALNQGEIHFELGHEFLDSGLYEEAEEQFELSLVKMNEAIEKCKWYYNCTLDYEEVQKTVVGTAYILAYVQLNLEKWDSAIANARVVVEYGDPDDKYYAKAYLILGLCYVAKGDLKAAGEELAVLRSLDTNLAKRLETAIDKKFTAGLWGFFSGDWEEETAESLPKIVFYDDFVDNRNGWVIDDNPNSSANINNGYYYLECKKELGWLWWMPVNINQDGDFMIESTMTKIDGVNNAGYGIVWGLSDANNNYQFAVNGNGSYYIGRRKNGKWHYAQDWTRSNVINKLNATNKLAVQRKGNQLKFFINDGLIFTSSFEGLFGIKVGFLIDDKIRLKIHDIKVRGIPY